MLKHIYINRLKCLFRDRQVMFWTLFFPILLATFFGLTFTGLQTIELFSAIPVAVVDNADYQADSALKGALESISGDKGLFVLQTLTKTQAEAQLESGDIVGYLVPGENLQVVVAKSGIQQTIIKIFADEYLQTTASFKSIITLNPAVLQTLGDRIGQRIDLLQEQPASKASPNNTVIYFYALIAMTCLYGSFWGMKEMIAIQANLSPLAARINMVPVHKLKIFGASLAAALTIQFAISLALLAYLNFVLNISFGSRIGLVLVEAFVGSLLGVVMGALVGSLSKANEGAKIGMLISFTMICSFLAGLMRVEIKYEVTSAVPIMKWINPGNLICDAFYALYYYEDYSRFLLNIVAQLAFIVVMFLIVYFILRRQRYASL